MNNYEFNVNLYEKMKITVVAENEEEARRILKDTLDSITHRRQTWTLLLQAHP